VAYREWSAAGDGALACLWEHRIGVRRHVQRVVPDGCMDLIWSPATGRLELAGPDTAAFEVPMAPGTWMVGLRFRPGMAPPAVGLPADAVRDVHTPLRDLWGATADRLAEDLARAADPAELLRATALDRLRSPGIPPDPAAPALAALLARESVREAAARLGFSERQLRRRAHAAFGYGPKTLQRILRFQQALSLARRGLPYADIAAHLGYADQAHLAHDTRTLGGVSLTVLAPADQGWSGDGGRRRWGREATTRS
jgi:AraC-like DNA-binding protein